MRLDRRPRVYLHVGLPKTGTTYLQDVLFRQKQALADAGLLVPGASSFTHFLATQDLTGVAFAGHAFEGIEGSWKALGGRDPGVGRRRAHRPRELLLATPERSRPRWQISTSPTCT